MFCWSAVSAQVWFVLCCFLLSLLSPHSLQCLRHVQDIWIVLVFICLTNSNAGRDYGGYFTVCSMLQYVLQIKECVDVCSVNISLVVGSGLFFNLKIIIFHQTSEEQWTWFNYGLKDAVKLNTELKTSMKTLAFLRLQSFLRHCKPAAGGGGHPFIYSYFFVEVGEWSNQEYCAYR